MDCIQSIQIVGYCIVRIVHGDKKLTMVVVDHSSNQMEWTTVRREQDLAYEQSLLQDALKKQVTEPDKKLTLAELREKRIQTFTQTSVKKT